MKQHLLAARTGTPLICWLAASILCVSDSQAAPSGQHARQAKQTLDKAEQKLHDSRQTLDTVLKQTQQAETAHAVATNALLKVRQAAAGKLAVRLGASTVVANRDIADNEVIRQRKSVLAALHARADFQAATNKAEQASPRLRGLDEDKLLTERESKLRTELSADMRRPFEMERAELAKDALFQGALRQLQTAEQKLMVLQREI